MAYLTQYVFATIDSDLSGGADFDKKLLLTAGSAAEVSAVIAPSSTEISYAFTEVGDPNNAAWATGSIVATINVVTGNIFGQLSLSASRVNSSGTEQETTSSTAEQDINTGDNPLEFTIPSYSWSSGSANDRLRLNFIFRNTTGKGNITVGITGDHATYRIQTQIPIEAPAATTHQEPTNLEIDYQTNPTMASEIPNFTAVFNAQGSSTATTGLAYIQVATSTAWTPVVAESGTINFTLTRSGDRCPVLQWDSQGATGTPWNTITTMKSTATYFWRMRFKDDDAGFYSLWSPDGDNWFKGFNRLWADDNYPFRQKLMITNTHPTISAGYTATFSLKTGNRQIPIIDAFFNETVPTSGGFAIANYGGKSHIVYLSTHGTTLNDHPFIGGETNRPSHGIKIITYDHSLGVFGTSFFVTDSGADIDSHYFPIIDADLDGYLHISYGSHESIIKYLRSKLSNISGGGPGDSAYSNLWGEPERAFYLSNSDIFSGADFSKQMQIVEDIATQPNLGFSLSLLPNAVATSFGYSINSAVWSTRWEEAPINIGINIKTGAAGSLAVSVSRADASSGAAIETTSVTSYQSIDSTGLKEFVVPAYAWSTGSIDDSLRVNYGFKNSTAASIYPVVNVATTSAYAQTEIFRRTNGELFDGTYPIVFTVNSGRTYLFARGEELYEYSFAYTDDNGSSWIQESSGVPFRFIHDNHSLRKRVYLYGLRYDKAIDRLHISWTYDHELAGDSYERGIWYAYSDYDETAANTLDVGWNIWRWVTGSIAGYTNNAVFDDIGFTNNILASWDQNAARAVSFGDSFEGRIFTETLVLNNAGEPIVFWEQKIRPGYPSPEFSATEETDLCCGKWNTATATWNITYIGNDLNYMLRVRRAGISVLTDIDNNIKVLMPVNAQTYWRQLPSSDGDDIVNCATLSTPSFHAEIGSGVGDNLTICDGDGSYIDLAGDPVEGNRGMCSFGHDGGFDTTRSLLEVRVDAVVKKTVGAATMRLYLYNGVATAVSEDIPVTTGTYQYYRYDWVTYPFTGEWGPATFDAVNFGVKNISNATIRLTRLMVEARYTIASDDELFATEIHELVSSNNGSTWSIRELTRNSHLGVNGMGHKHHRTMDLIESIWGSGNDIFYQKDQSNYGFVKSNATDARIYYGGVEIDRILDYADLDESLFRFRIQGTINRNNMVGDDDYYVYYGNQNEVTQPLSDPNNVYLWFENWETYFFGDATTQLISDNWNVTSGTFSIYNSPPNQHNKLYAGDNTLFADSSNEVVPISLSRRIISTPIENCFVEMGFLNEVDASARTKYEVTASTYIGVAEGANEVRLGEAYHTSMSPSQRNAMWYVAASWNYETNATFPEYMPVGRQMHEIKLQTTDRGASFWYDGKQVKREVRAGAGTVTAVGTLNIYNPIDGYYDYIRVSQKVERTTASTNFAAAVGHMSTLQWPTPSPTLDVINDIVREFSEQSRITRLNITLKSHEYDNPNSLPVWAGAVTHYYRLWFTYATQYDSTNIAFYQDVDHEFTPTSGDASTTILFENLPAGPISFMVDLYDSSVMYPVWPTSISESADIVAVSGDVDTLIVNNFDVEQDPIFTPDARETKGFYFDYTLQGPGRSTFKGIYDIKGTKRLLPLGSPVEYRKGIQSTKTIPVENLAVKQVTNSIPVDWIGVFTGDYTAPIEYGTTVKIDGSIPVDYLSFISSLKGRTPIEWGVVLDHLQTIPIEYNTLIEMAGTQVIEYLEDRTIDSTIPTSFTGLLETIYSIPMEWPGVFSSTHSIPIETTLLSEMIESLPVEYGTALSTKIMTPIEWRGALQQILSLPIEHGSLLTTVQTQLIEYLKDRKVDNSIPISFESSLDTTFSFPIEFLQQITSNTITTPISWLLSQTAKTYSFPIEHGQGVKHTYSIPISFTSPAVFTVRGAIPIEFKQGKIFDFGIPLEFLTNKIIDQTSPIEWGIQINFLTQIPIEFNVSVALVNAQIPIEHLLGTESINQTIPVSYTIGNKITYNIPIEIKSGISFASSVPVEFGGIVTQSSSIPISFLVLNESISNSIPLETRKGVDVTGAIPIEFESAISEIYTGLIPIEINANKEIVSAIPISYTKLSDFSSTIPSEFLSTISEKGAIQVEYLGSTEFINSLNVEYGGLFSQVTSILSEWLGGTEYTGILNIEYTSGVTAFESSLTLNIEYGGQIVSTQTVEVENLLQMVREVGIPIEFTGEEAILVAKILISNINIKKSGLC